MKKKSGFLIWEEYWGELFDDEQPSFRTKIYGFENISASNLRRNYAQVPPHGTSFGYVGMGSIGLRNECIDWYIAAGQYFSIPGGFAVELLESGTRMMISQSLNFHGLYCTGGPIETRGRLQYIDGCSDTLLISPPLLGDPCQNLLHFPQGINQTPHTHPSSRSGMIARGTGNCIAAGERFALEAGRIFYIPKNTVHQFQTFSNQQMDVIAYHPDSDWGPTHQEHPMINRTLVDGTKVDNSLGVHTTAEYIEGTKRQ